MTFAHPKILYLLFIIPVLALLFFWARVARQKNIKIFGKNENIASLMPDASLYMPAIKTVLEMIAIATLIIALARPRSNQMQENEEKANGIELVVALDISKSMDASSTDNAKSVSRLNRAKLLIDKMIDRLGSNRIGLVLFAGSSMTHIPITNDYISARLLLDEVNTSTAPFQGTNIASAIEKSLTSFSDLQDVNKAIVVITDSEDHEPGAVEMAAKAAEAGIEVDVIGIGMGGAPIPVNESGNEFLKDAQGNTVMTALNEELAQQIAQKGGGIYIDGSSGNATDAIVEQLDKIEKKELGTMRFRTSAERFPLFIWIAFGALILNIFVLERKYSWIDKLHIFSKKK